MTTVAELIKVLEQLPKDLPVWVATYEELFEDVRVEQMEADNVFDHPPHVRLGGA